MSKDQRFVKKLWKEVRRKIRWGTTPSDHSVNKDTSEAIVYCFDAGDAVLLTDADFASREEFERWKKWSDRDYAKIEGGNRKYNRHKVPLFDQDATIPSAEQELFVTADRAHREQAHEILIDRLLCCLTPIQERRIVLYYGVGLDQEAIARKEGVTQPRVNKSLKRAQKKMMFANCKLSVKTGDKNKDFLVLSERGRKRPLKLLENLIDNVIGTKPA